MFKSNQEQTNTKKIDQRFAFIKNQNLPQPFSKNSQKDKWQQSFLKSSNYSKSPYQEPQSIHSRNESFHQQQSQHSASQDSTFSFHQYREILNNLFQNSEHQQQWKQVPQIVKLIIKAMSLSINAIENKVVQNREIINDQGLQIKENKLSIQNTNKGLKKLNEKVSNIRLEESIIEANQQKQKKRSFIKDNQQSQQNQLFTKGLDLIMIEQVKTLTDAIISKRIQDVLIQIEDLQQKLQQKFTKQHQKLNGEIYALKTWIPQLQIKQKLQQQKFQQSLKQHLTIIDKRSSHLVKQLQDQKQAMCQLGHYIEEQFCKRQEINSLLKNNYDTKTNKLTQSYDSINNSLNLNKNKIQQIVKYEIQSYQFLKKKDFDEFKQKIMKNFNTFATMTEVQKIVNKANKLYKSQNIGQTTSLGVQLDTLKDQQTLELKKPKSFYQKIQTNSKQKSPMRKKEKPKKISKKQNQKQIYSSKAIKNKVKQRKISQFSHEQAIYESPIIIDEKSYKTKSTPQDQSWLKVDKQEIEQQIQQNLSRKMQNKMKQIRQSTKQIITEQINNQLSKLEKKLTKRLETAEEQFCAVVEQNWRTMSENNLKIQKSQKQNMENLLKVVSVLNVIARYSTIVNCQINQSIRWQKEVFNSTGKGVVTLSTDKSLIYVGIPGVYAVHIVMYTLYDPIVSFVVQINGEEVGRRIQKIGVKKPEQQKNQDSLIQQKKSQKNKNPNPSNIYHPSRGAEFTATLLIPAKSNLTIRLLNQLNGQALMQIRKM